MALARALDEKRDQTEQFRIAGDFGRHWAAFDRLAGSRIIHESVFFASITRGNGSFLGRVETSSGRILPSIFSHIHDPPADNRLQPDHFSAAIAGVALRDVLVGIGSRASVA